MLKQQVLLVKNLPKWDFPGGPVVKTPCFHCRGHRFGPGGGTKTKKKNLPFYLVICVSVLSVILHIKPSS